ncbi:MAG: hypothetical protein RI572_13825 [Salegentibacter sp.]|uniref:Uncharacterized protein n=1 Tax=Salegentibacter flavus TaxID=287099 RepID=A0A1I4ZJ59_9FLAO|nr:MULTISPECIES: hypothetical protein [Salegentibacter]MDR9458479.1 hypothetical protein [Salegentibacter sp.]SFN50019.1 hypothetical protein SAMN05660413_01361 [Salegentibacter flavus]
MEKEVIYVEDLHVEHQQWLGELEFWKDELKSFNNRLAELVNRWSNKDVLAQLEHFQNQFILHEEFIDNQEKLIHAHETNMADHDKKEHMVINTGLAKNHLDIRDRMQDQRKIYAALKKDFYKFLSKYM